MTTLEQPNQTAARRFAIRPSLLVPVAAVGFAALVGLALIRTLLVLDHLRPFAASTDRERAANEKGENNAALSHDLAAPAGGAFRFLPRPRRRRVESPSMRASSTGPTSRTGR